jgi:hypothetical protein
VSTGGGGGPAGSAAGWIAGSGAGGSANATGAVPTGIAMQTAASVAKRFNMIESAPLVIETQRIHRICRGGASNGWVATG